MIRTPNESHLFPSLVEKKPKYCGAEFVASSHFPEDWRGNFLTCDFRALPDLPIQNHRPRSRV